MAKKATVKKTAPKKTAPKKAPKKAAKKAVNPEPSAPRPFVPRRLPQDKEAGMLAEIKQKTVKVSNGSKRRKIAFAIKKRYMAQYAK